ncbi:MAG: SMP-30/gluconolactonase/LRE family protein [Acidobacteriota bacterium]
MLTTRWERRSFLTAALGAAAVRLSAQQVSPNAGPRDWSGNAPLRYPDPDIITVDRRFAKYVLFNTPMQRLHTGTMWAEGPAWNGVGRYMVWSDIPNNVQLRWIADDNRITVFHNPSGYSNGNTFDREGRQLSCEHAGRRVARYEGNGTITTIAEKFEGKRLNSPNDIVVHPNDGSIWFTDPTYGINGNYEGFQATPELKQAVYRVDGQSGALTKVTEEVNQPNGLCFSPDLKKLYVADTGSNETKVFDVDGRSLRNGKQFVKLTVPGGGASAADGIRCDVDGNVWCGANPGVQVVAPDGMVIGMIRLPEQCANLCFGGVKRNRLFMTASQSLYSVYVGTMGAGIA